VLDLFRRKTVKVRYFLNSPHTWQKHCHYLIFGEESTILIPSSPVRLCNIIEDQQLYITLTLQSWAMKVRCTLYVNRDYPKKDNNMKHTTFCGEKMEIMDHLSKHSLSISVD
jgi:hypothetical protein